LREVTTRTFNSISIDGDTSTNDTLLVLANGEAGAPSIEAGSRAHRAFAWRSRMFATRSLCNRRDGEGAQRRDRNRGAWRKDRSRRSPDRANDRDIPL